MEVLTQDRRASINVPLFSLIPLAKFYLFILIWLCQVLVAALGIFDLCCCMWNLQLSLWGLVPQPGSNPGVGRMESQPLDHQGNHSFSKVFESIYSMPAYTDQSWEKMFTAEICPCQEIEIHKYLHLENRHIIYILAGMCYFAKGFPKGCFPIVSSQHFQVNKFSRNSLWRGHVYCLK